VQYHPAYGLLPAMESPKMSQISKSKLDKVVMVLEVMQGLIESSSRTTKRDIFYQHFCDLSSQRELDSLVAVIVAMVQVPRLLLGVVATSKGLVVGDLCYINSEDVLVDCSLAVGGDSVPQDVVEMRDVKTSAKFVLVVEKDAVFQRLLEEGVMGGHLPSMIMITGKGVPDLASRQLVYMLSMQMGLPVMIMTDCDPYGVDICMMYKYGSLAMAWAAEPLAVPTSVWLGLLPSDISRLSIMSSSMKSHSDQDFKKMVDLNNRQYVREDMRLRGELEILWEMGRKAEIQQVVEERVPGRGVSAKEDS
jgi:meiotic recombination protein SPO11